MNWTTSTNAPGAEGVMSKTFVLITFFLIAFAAPFPSVAREPVTVKGLSSGELIQYINGLADGFSYYHVMLGASGKTPLFCPPGDTIGAREVWTLISNNLSGQFEDKRTLGAAAVSKLQDKYPCATK